MTRQTTISINVYSGVPFDTSYKNVLFVPKEQMTEFLSQYEIGSTVFSNRFEIIDDTTAIVDLTNDFECLNANYVKVHRILQPETTDNTYEFDAYYFVTNARQIATNVIRLYLSLDVFQTQFNKYDYQKQNYEIPQIKKSNVIVSTDFENAEERKIVVASESYNNNFIIKPLIERTANNLNAVYVVFTFTTNNGISTLTAITQKPTSVLGTIITEVYALYNDIIGGLQNGKIYYADNGEQIGYDNIEILNVYIIPSKMINTDLFVNLQSGYYLKNPQNSNSTVNVLFGEMSRIFTGQSKKYVDTLSIDLTLTPYMQTQIGTIETQIDLPYNSKPYNVKIDIVIASEFKVMLYCNNQSIDLTSSFEINVIKNAYNEFMNSKQNALGVKQIANAINLLSSVRSLASGNPAGIISTVQSITNIADEYSQYADLKNKPAMVKGQHNIDYELLFYNIICVFENKPSNYDELVKTTSYFGYKLNYLTDKIFNYDNIKNFDYYKFDKIQVVGKLPLNFKLQIEQMFLNGIRVWYNKDNFLNTIS